MNVPLRRLLKRTALNFYIACLGNLRLEGSRLATELAESGVKFGDSSQRTAITACLIGSNEPLAGR